VKLRENTGLDLFTLCKAEASFKTEPDGPVKKFKESGQL